VVHLRIKIPPAKTREEFRILYELKGAQRALNYLACYYSVRKMKIILNGKKVGKGCEAVYFCNKAFFTKKGLNRENALHELYHHLVFCQKIDKPERIEEKEANIYAKSFLK
jgi:hypothetical protein